MRRVCTAVLVLASLMSGCAEKKEASWIEYSSAEGKFKASFPGQPTVETRQGDAGPMTGVQYKVSNGESYMVMFGEPPSLQLLGDSLDDPAALDGLLDGMVELMVKRLKLKLLHQKKIMVGNLRGIDAQYQMKDSVFGRQRFFYKGKRLYQLIVIRENETDLSSSEVERFIQSVVFVD